MHIDGLLIPVYIVCKCFDDWHPAYAGAILRVPQRIGALQHQLTVPGRWRHLGYPRTRPQRDVGIRQVSCLPVFSRVLTIVSAHAGIFPGRGSVVWRDWYSHDVVNATAGAPTTLAAPLGHINVHIRDGSAILLHSAPAYTIEETRQGPYSLLVSQTTQGVAHGTAYVDDGISSPPGPSRTLSFAATKNQVSITGAGGFHIASKLQDVTVLGVGAKPATVLLNGQRVGNWTYTVQQHKLVAHTVGADLNQPLTLQWK